jgi:hypothetical protein
VENEQPNPAQDSTPGIRVASRIGKPDAKPAKPDRRPEIPEKSAKKASRRRAAAAGLGRGWTLINGDGY